MRGATKEECGGRTPKVGEELVGGDGPCQTGSKGVDVLCSFLRDQDGKLEPVFLLPGTKVQITNGNGRWQQFPEGLVFEAVPHHITHYGVEDWFSTRYVDMDTIRMMALLDLSNLKGVTVKVVEVPNQVEMPETIFSRLVRKIKTFRLFRKEA